MTAQPRLLITSTSNHRIVATRKLRQRKYRERYARFLVEGLQLLHMALDAGWMPLEVFYCPDVFKGEGAPRLLARLGSVHERRGVRATTGTEIVADRPVPSPEIIRVSPDVMQALSPRCACQGIVATFPRVEMPLASLVLSPDDLVVVLDRIRDPGNTGTLIRVADAVGAAAVILLASCVDIFDPRAVRASMGSIFNVAIACEKDVDRLFRLLRAAGLCIIAADPYKGIDWGHGLWHSGVALVLGNEAGGLSDQVRGQVDGWARLPMVGKAESLNVAIAGGVLMYGWLAANMKSMA